MAVTDAAGKVYPLVPLRNMVMFPGVITSLRIGRPRSLAAVEKAMSGDRRLALVAQREAQVPEPSPEEMYDVGVIGDINAARHLPDENVTVLAVTGVERCRIAECVQQVPYIAARAQPLPEAEEEVPEPLREQVRRLYAAGGEEQERLRLLEALPPSVDLADIIAFHLDIPVADKQRLLAEPSPLNRCRMIVPVLEVEAQIAQAGRSIWTRSREEVGEKGRAAYLRSRKGEIERELRELTGRGAESEELRQRLEKAQLPDEARQEAERELARLSRMTVGEPEYGVAEDFLDWLLSLPWHQSTEAAVDLSRARQVLDRDHYDRAEVKERILEYLSVRKLNPSQEGALLCFVGAPGVGKTSMGRSIAEATGRKFYRVSLGGVDDEAEIRGHRRTYLGALPGCIIRALRRVGVNNPVLLLDELDKLGSGLRGDPTAALLEALDPAQNKTFVDNYVSVPFDLSRIMFIGTANITDTIPPPLLDRLEVIELSGYTTEEKIAIARHHLVPKQLPAAGLKDQLLEVDDDALELLVEQYTREAGVRNLERQIASVCRKLAKEQMGGAYRYRNVDRERVLDLLGPPPYHPERSDRADRPGVCPTLAVSWLGAGLMMVEVAAVEGTGKLIVTGRAGEVLRQGASLAYSFWKSRAEGLGLDASRFRKLDFHVHFPGGESPKEGSSAGLAVALGFASFLKDTPLPEGLAALGHITLHGRVLPVDRLIERLAAAQRAGIGHVLVPERNRADVEAPHDFGLPPDLKVTYVGTVVEAVQAALPRAFAGQEAVH
jgi:ATP-dependent Lon protease